MGALEKASSRPGNASKPPGASFAGVTTFTDGIAWVSVQSLSRCSSLARSAIPTTTTMTASTPPTIATYESWRCGSVARGVGSDDMCRISGNRRGRSAAPMRVKYAKHGRHEQQRGNGREQQSPNYRAAQWRVLLATFAECERHWRHADDHRQ